MFLDRGLNNTFEEIEVHDPILIEQEQLRLENNRQLAERGAQLSRDTQEILRAIKVTPAPVKSNDSQLLDEPSINSSFRQAKLRRKEWERIDNYKDMKKFIRNLLEDNFSIKKKIFLKELRDSVEDVKPLSELQRSIRIFHDFNVAEGKFKKIQTEIENNSLLNNNRIMQHPALYGRFKQLEKVIVEAETHLFGNPEKKVEGHKLILCSFTLEQKAKPAFNNFKKEQTAINFKYPDSYSSIAKTKEAMIKSSDQPTSIHQAISIFEDYHKKNSILYFHWRHHSPEAKRIQSQLNNILLSNKNPIDKINDAIRVILKEENEIADRRKLRSHNKHESSFFRRAHYVIGLLDAERNRLTQNSLPRRNLFI